MVSQRNHRKRRASLSSMSEDDNDRSRKHSKRESEKGRKIRKDDKERKRRKKDDKSSGSREAKDKEAKGKHRHSKKLADSGFKELLDEDYYSKNNEFSTWLKEERGIYFSDLSSEDARGLFSSFIKAWNRQKLQPQYYHGIASAPRTAHIWKIKHEK